MEALYRSVVAARRSAYAGGLFKAWRAPIPVISVGNLVVGGTGKTPVTAWLVAKLLESGARPAVLLRGYGDDEARLHRRWNPGAPVLSGRDRTRSAGEAAAKGATVAILDDGFQHRRLARNFEVVLVAAEERFPGRLLPRGPYRETAAALAAADLVVVTRRTAADAEVEATLEVVARAAPGCPTAVLRLAPRAWTGLFGEPAPTPGGDVLAVTGVARPLCFKRMVREALPGAVELMAFPDHHAFTAADARRIRAAARGRTVVMTEKDAVKLEGLAPLMPAVRVLTLEVRAERGGDALQEALRRAAQGGTGA